MIYLALVSLLWAFSFGLIGTTLAGLDSMFMATLRLLIALACFSPLLRLTQRSPKEIFQLLGIGALQFGVMYSAYMYAYQFLPSYLVALFSVFTPLYIVIAHSSLKGSFRWQLIGCAALSIAGAGIIKFAHPEGSIWIGFGLMQLSNVAFGLGQLFYREWKLKRPETKDQHVIALLYAGGALLAGLVYLMKGNLSAPLPDARQWLVLIYLGAVASGLGFFLWNKGCSLVRPGALAAFNNALVPLAMASSLFVFGEIAQVQMDALVKLLAGTALIVCGIAWGRKA